jgi:hypothetical protein
LFLKFFQALAEKKELQRSVDDLKRERVCVLSFRKPALSKIQDGHLVAILDFVFQPVTDWQIDLKFFCGFGFTKGRFLWKSTLPKIQDGLGFCILD